MQDCRANLNESGKTQEKENRNVQKKYRANHDAQERGKLRKVWESTELTVMISQKTKDKETDSKCKLDYRGNLDEAVTEKIKLSDSKKKKENWRILLKRERISDIFNNHQVENMIDLSILFNWSI